MIKQINIICTILLSKKRQIASKIQFYTNNMLKSMFILIQTPYFINENPYNLFNYKYITVKNFQNMGK